MSIPAFAWALEQGRARKLPTSERMLLVVIADRGNGHRACSAGQECLANDTGLKERQVRISLRALEAHGLIRIEKAGKSRLYHVLRPLNGEDHTPAHTAAMTPAHTAAIPAQNAAELSTTPAACAGVQRTTPARNAPTPAFCAETPAHTAAKPLLNQENLSRAHAREASKILDSNGKKEAEPPAPSVPQASQDATTTGSVPVSAMRNPDDPFRDDGGASKAYASRLLGRTVHLATPQLDTVTEDDRPQTDADRERMAAEIAKAVESLAGSGPPGVKARKGAWTMRAYPPGARNVFDAEQQQDIYRALQRPEPRHLVGEQLAAARRIAMAQLAHTP
jgi:Helix-turn-helix domain